MNLTDKYVYEINYINAKNELVKFINSMPETYGISFVMVEEILNDVSRQVHSAALNDYNALMSMLKSASSQESTEEVSIGEKDE